MQLRRTVGIRKAEPQKARPQALAVFMAHSSVAQILLEVWCGGMKK